MKTDKPQRNHYQKPKIEKKENLENSPEIIKVFESQEKENLKKAIKDYFYSIKINPSNYLSFQWVFEQELVLLRPKEEDRRVDITEGFVNVEGEVK